jgi:DNA modification methylase
VFHATGAAYVNNVVGKRQEKSIPNGFKPKDLFLIPERLAIALQDAGWYVRSRIAWTKNSVMPESIRDRPTSAWEHIWMLTKSPVYFWDKEAVLEDAVCDRTRGPALHPDLLSTNGNSGLAQRPVTGSRNIRNVWLINPKPFKGAHFATFPPDLPDRCIRAATSEAGCCPTCGSPLRRIVEKGEPDRDHMAACGADLTGGYAGQSQKDYASAGAQNASDTKRRILEGMVKKRTIGWAQTCKCSPADPVPALVLDPFAGSGTTLMVARQLGRDSVGIELNEDYVAMAAERIGGDVYRKWVWGR